MTGGAVGVDCGVGTEFTTGFVTAALGNNTLSQQTLRDQEFRKVKKRTWLLRSKSSIGISSPSSSGSGDCSSTALSGTGAGAAARVKELEGVIKSRDVDDIIKIDLPSFYQ
jgi:hypothetical protein